MWRCKKMSTHNRNTQTQNTYTVKNNLHRHLLVPQFPQVSWLSPSVARPAWKGQSSPSIQTLSEGARFSVKQNRPPVKQLNQCCRWTCHNDLLYSATYNVVVSVEASHDVVTDVSFTDSTRTHLTQVKCFAFVCTCFHTFYYAAQTWM